MSYQHGSIFYNSNKEAILEKTCLKVVKFNGQNRRDYIGSIYRVENTPDYYDSDRIIEGFKNQSNYVTPKAMIDMKKQKGRDFTALYASSAGEAYKNIQR